MVGFETAGSEVQLAINDTEKWFWQYKRQR